MNASQDAWAAPLAKRMINRFRSLALTYIKVSPRGYDETLGEIVNSETAYTAAGAVTRSTKTERDGVQQGHEVEAWVDHETVPWPISSNDCLQYLGRRWKITEIESYGSGGDGSATDPVRLIVIDGKTVAVRGYGADPAGITMYASKIIARAE